MCMYVCGYRVCMYMSSELRFRNPGFSSHSWASSFASLSPTLSESLGSGTASRAQESVTLPVISEAATPWPGWQDGPLPPVSNLCPQLVVGLPQPHAHLPERVHTGGRAGPFPPDGLAAHRWHASQQLQPGSAKGSGMASGEGCPIPSTFMALL